jgi:hypothetical protein
VETLPVVVVVVVPKLKETAESERMVEHLLPIQQAVVAEQEIHGTITHSRQGDLWLRFGWM